MAPEETLKDTPTAPEVTPTEAAAPAVAEQADEGEPQQDTQAETLQEGTPVEAESSAAEGYEASSRAELIEALRRVIARDVSEAKEEVELIKQIFYKKLRQEQDALQQADDQTEESAEAVVQPAKDDLEDALKSLLADFKEKKAAHAARMEQEKKNNLSEKQHILERMEALVGSADDAAAHIGEFKDLQQKWKTIGAVPAANSNDLWKRFNLLQEKFWDLIKINNELREYDFKKNLEAKLQLCDAAEQLITQTDVVAAARQLQKLHEDWREIGPVAREMREEVWNRFKAATSEINKKHQSYFENLRRGEEENLAKKVALCEKIEAIDTTELKTYAAWDQTAQAVKAIQEEWRMVGFAPRKQNQKVYERYRKACDEFFSKKSTFFKEQKAAAQANLEKKRSLCEQAEALKDSTDWKDTTDKLVKLQAEWKATGAVPKKFSDDLWKRFVAACDHFFEQKNKDRSERRSEEQENLKKKKAIIEELNALDLTDAEKAHTRLKQLVEEFRGVGHVPFRDKDKVYKAFRTALDKQFDALNIDASNRRLESFRSNLENMSTQGEQKLYREREKMLRAYEHLKAEIATCENNMGFFSAKSQRADNILKEMERKIEGLKEECRLLEQKINMIEEKL